MGWLEFQAWVDVMNRQANPPKADPGSWAGADQDPDWIEMRRKQAEALQRGG